MMKYDITELAHHGKWFDGRNYYHHKKDDNLINKLHDEFCVLSQRAYDLFMVYYKRGPISYPEAEKDPELTEAERVKDEKLKEIQSLWIFEE
ncbi:MAG TPA: hypothetical protein ENH82_04300 [bacterium]|nr:hypothetical protein [bacterium]